MILDNELGDPIHSPPALQPYEPSSKNEKQKKKKEGEKPVNLQEKKIQKKKKEGEKPVYLQEKKVLKKKRETERQERGEIEFQRGKKKK